MDRLDTLQLFTRIVEQASFGRAADLLGIPRATATHAIKALETRLGTRLLERSTRHVRPTLDGQAYYERCVQVLSDLGPSGRYFHVVRAVATPPFPLRPIDAYTYSVGLAPNFFDSSLPAYRFFP